MRVSSIQMLKNHPHVAGSVIYYSFTVRDFFVCFTNKYSALKIIKIKGKGLFGFSPINTVVLSMFSVSSVFMILFRDGPVLYALLLYYLSLRNL